MSDDPDADVVDEDDDSDEIPRQRKLADNRLLRASGRCPDDRSPMQPTGYAYSFDEDSVGPNDWLIVYRCPLHPEELIPLWQPEYRSLFEEILAEVNPDDLPMVGSALD